MATKSVETIVELEGFSDEMKEATLKMVNKRYKDLEIGMTIDNSGIH